MIRLGLLLPHLSAGGIEKGMVALQRALPAHGIQAVFLLQHLRGELLEAARAQGPVLGLGGKGVRGSIRPLARAVADQRLDVVYSATNATNVLNLLSALGRSGRKPKRIVAEHIPLNLFLGSRRWPGLRRALIRGLYPRADAVAAPSQGILDEHAAILGASCPPCTVLPNPIVETVQTPKDLAPTALHLVCIGRLSPEKGFDLAIEAFANLLSKLPQARLTIYGEGGERTALQTLIDQRGLTDRVALPGYVADVPSALAGADMLLSTSRMEGFGNALVEAQAAGVPVLAVDCPFGPALILKRGQAGRLVQGRDPQTLAQAILAFATDPDARRAAQSAGLGQAALYTVQSSAQAHAQLIRDLVA